MNQIQIQIQISRVTTVQVPVTLNSSFWPQAAWTALYLPSASRVPSTVGRKQHYGKV